MNRSHPLGDDFARWVELTDDYEARIAHASSAKDLPDREGLAGMVRRVRELSQAATVWHRRAAPHH